MNLAGTTYEGPLEKKTNKWKEYHVVLKSGQLFFYKDRSPNAGLLGTLELSVTTFCNAERGVLFRGYQFSVSTPSTEAYLRANTAELRDTWIKEIMQAVTELNTFRHSLALSGSVRPHPSTQMMMPDQSQVYDSTLVVHVGTPEHEWYWPGKTREQAEQMLRGVDRSHFLVRDSGHEAGSYSLSVGIGSTDNKIIYHYIIKRDLVENKFILVPEPEKRFDTLSDVISFYLTLNRAMELLPLRNPAYKGPVRNYPAAPNNYITHGDTVTQHPHHDEDTEYVRLGKFASESNRVSKKAQDISSDESSPQKPPKPNRPTVTTRDTDYMNVAPAFKEPAQSDVVTGSASKDGNYIYAAVQAPNNGAVNGNIASPGDFITIRGDERSTPAVARFGNFGSSSLFEDSLPPSASADSSCYVNFDIQQSMGSMSVATDERPKSSGMSKSSAKAGKNKVNKQTSGNVPKPVQYYNQQYPPAATGPISYNDPSQNMSAPPSHKGHRNQMGDAMLPAAATGHIAYTDPSVNMAAPPTKIVSTKALRQQQLEGMFPAANPGMPAYNDPSLSMSSVPTRVKNSTRH